MTKPKTMDGTPARLFVICLIIFLGQPSLHIHSCKLRLIHQQESKYHTHHKTKQSVPTIAGKNSSVIPFWHSANEFPANNPPLVTIKANITNRSPTIA
jgi:hypothetical protein